MALSINNHWCYGTFLVGSQTMQRSEGISSITKGAVGAYIFNFSVSQASQATHQYSIINGSSGSYSNAYMEYSMAAGSHRCENSTITSATARTLRDCYLVSGMWFSQA